jgi:hypothetical protein
MSLEESAQRMSEGALVALLDADIETAQNYADSALAPERARALDFYYGEIDIAPDDGGSAATTTDVADTIEWILPTLLRIFTQGAEIARFEPVGPEDEVAARQATDYANHVFMKDNPGFLVLYTWFKDALLHKNGVIKHFWEETPVVRTVTLGGLSIGELTNLFSQAEANSDSLDIVEQRVQGETGLFDVTLKRVQREGKIRIEAVPPEEFLIDPQARSLESARFVAHAATRHAGSLIAQGFDPALIDALPSAAQDFRAEARGRTRAPSWPRDARNDGPGREIAVYECYRRIDWDADGVAELRKVTLARGGSGGRGIVLENVAIDEVPFSDLSPILMPHRWAGRSVAELVMDIQRIKSVLMRQMLDNLYRVNNPQKEVASTGADQNTLDDLLTNRVGGIVRVRTPGTINPLTTPFVAGASFPMLDYLDKVRASRTGVSEAAAGLDPNALQNQTATAVDRMFSAAQGKVELIARVFAETGVKRAFRSILRLLIRHQHKARLIRLRQEWITMDPRAWNADMDVTVTVGLGAGHRDREIGLLNTIAEKQENILQQLGPQNPLVSMKQYYNTLARLVEAAGLKTPHAYFTDPSTAPVPLPTPSIEKQDPQLIAMLAEIDRRKQALAAEIGQRQAEFQAKQQLDALKLAADIRLRQSKLALDAALKQAPIPPRPKPDAGSKGESEPDQRASAAASDRGSDRDAG